MKKVILILVLFIASYGSYAQRDFSYFNQMVAEAEYIFEAKGIGYTCYWTSDSQIYTSNILEITKVFKGEIQLGTVEILSFGGNVDGVSTSWDCNISTPKDIKIILFCKKTQKEPIKKNYEITNATPLEIVEECGKCWIGIGDNQILETEFGPITPFAYGCDTYFLSKDELYNTLPERSDKNIDKPEKYKQTFSITPEERELYLRKEYKSHGATEDEIDSMLNNPLLEKKIFENLEKKEKRKKKTDEGLLYELEYQNNKEHHTKSNFIKQYETNGAYQSSIFFLDNGYHQIIYSLQNPTYTGQSDYEFDIYVQGNNDSTYFTLSTIYINYDSEVFGANAWENAVITKGEAISGWDYKSPTKQPYSNSTFKIICSIDFALPNERFHLTTNPCSTLPCENDIY